MEVNILYTIELIAIASFAVPGATVAIEKGLDIFGVVFIGVIAALGGGVLRDLILGIFPPIMFVDKNYTIVAALTSLFIFLFASRDSKKYFNNIVKVDWLVNIIDAIGISLYSVTSVQRCFYYGYGDNGFLCIMMAMTTCIGGSIIRDCLCQKLPALLRKKIYALAVIAGSAVYYNLYVYGFNINISMIIGAITTFSIRMLATKYKWNMPYIKKPID